MKYGTWNMMSVTGPLEVLEDFRNRTFSVDPDAPKADGSTRMALDLNKAVPKPHQLEDHMILALYLRWYHDRIPFLVTHSGWGCPVDPRLFPSEYLAKVCSAYDLSVTSAVVLKAWNAHRERLGAVKDSDNAFFERGRLAQAVHFISGNSQTSKHWGMMAAGFASLTELAEHVQSNPTGNIVRMGIDLLRAADPDCESIAMKSWVYENWRTEENTCERYGGQIVRQPGSESAGIMTCRFDTGSWAPFPIFERLVTQWPELDFRFVSCTPFHGDGQVWTGCHGIFKWEVDSDDDDEMNGAFVQVMEYEFGYDYSIDWGCEWEEIPWFTYPSWKFLPSTNYQLFDVSRLARQLERPDTDRWRQPIKFTA